MARRVLIVGGVAGGASCAARLRRLDEHAEIVMFEKGPAISFANCGLPYHVGGVIAERQRLLVQTPEAMRARFRVEARTGAEVVAIDRAAKAITVRAVATGATSRESYDKLVLAPGAAPIRPPLPGIDLPGVHTLRDLPGMDAIIARMKERTAAGAAPGRAVVVGGGFIGLEMAENFHARGWKVTIIERLPQVLGMFDAEMVEPIHAELEAKGVALCLGGGIERIDDAGAGVLRVGLAGGAGSVECDLVLLAIGVKPEVDLGRGAGLTIGTRGGFVVNEFMQTNDPDIYAVGDAVETRNFVTGEAMLCALAGPANRQGRLVANHIAGVPDAYRGSQATAILGLFGKSAGITGLSERAARAAGLPAASVFITANNHAGYYPGAQSILAKLVYRADTGAILGAQAVGGEGVDKRIDVIATAQRAGMTVQDLEHLELAYAPQFGSAKDPVNVLGFVAGNALRGESPIAQWDEAVSLDGAPAESEAAAILDVRTPGERATRHIPGSTHIPLDELRGRLDGLPRDRRWLVHCASGLRSHIATRILRGHGFEARNIAGGFSMYLLKRTARSRRGK